MEFGPDTSKRDLIRAMTFASAEDSYFLGVAQDIGLLWCTDKAVALLEHRQGTAVEEAIDFIAARGWAQILRYPDPDPPIEGYEDMVVQLAAKDLDLAVELQDILERNEHPSAPDKKPEKANARAERCGILLGFPPASAHWYAYHGYYEGFGSVRDWSSEERAFGYGLHPHDPADLAADRAWARHRAAAFAAAYGDDLLPYFSADLDQDDEDVPPPEPFNPEGYPSPSSHCAVCRRAHPFMVGR